MRLAVFPVVVVGRAIQRSLGDADQQAHQRYAFMRSSGEVADLPPELENFTETHDTRLTVVPNDGDPPFSRKIHPVPLVIRGAPAHG